MPHGPKTAFFLGPGPARLMMRSAEYLPDAKKGAGAPTGGQNHDNPDNFRRGTAEENRHHLGAT